MGRPLYFCPASFFLLLLFPSPIVSAVVDWMSTILPHMLWPQCEFRMQVWDVLHATRWKIQDAKKLPKNRHLGTIAQICRAVSSQRKHVSTIEKNTLNSNTSSTCPHNMVNFGLLTAENCWRVWGTTANFNRFRVLAALLHGILVVGVSQTLRPWTEGATYIRQGGHHVGHWPTFLVMAALRSRCGHYIFALWFLSFCLFLFLA